MSCAAQVFQVSGMSVFSQSHKAVLTTAAALLALVVVTGCSSVPTTLVKVYQIDVVQGNVVTREQVQALRAGLPKPVVRDILGSPLVTSVFHGDRWDYVFGFSRQGQAMQQRRFTVYFKDGALERFEGDDLPSEADFVATLDRRPVKGDAPVLQATEEQLNKLTPPRPTTQPASPVVPQPVDRVYPPLEPTGAPK
jgi:outer membrane protein assembly factor BamE